MSAADRLATLLEQEREAAIRADTLALVELQHRKRTLLSELDPSDPARERLASLARRNLWLLRHLQRCYEGVLGLDKKTVYGAQGMAQKATSRRDWGSR